MRRAGSPLSVPKGSSASEPLLFCPFPSTVAKVGAAPNLASGPTNWRVGTWRGRCRCHGAGLELSLDVDEALATFMVGDLPDPALFLKIFGDVLSSAAEMAIGEHPNGYDDTAAAKGLR
jgi:hypothetical protein